MPHLVVQAVGCGEAGNATGELDSGGRSSDTHGFDVPVRGRTSWWSGSSPRSNPSRMTRPGAGYGIGSHDGDEARRRRASELMGTTSTVRDRPRGQGETVVELTAVLTSKLARSGKHGRRRIDDEVVGGRILKMSSGTALWGFRRGVAR